MSKPSSSRRDSPKDQQPKPVANLLSDAEQSRGSALHDSLHRRRRAKLQNAPAVPGHDDKQSRRAQSAAARLSAEGHDSKPNGENTSPWKLEHQWPHRRDRVEGRNHGVDGK
jgi:hypothetical protein